MLLYKAPLHGAEVNIIGRYVASSKTCYYCKKVNEDLTLKDRVWSCSCGATHHRDFNASKNIECVGIRDRDGLGGSFSPVYRKTPGHVEELVLKLKKNMGSLKDLVSVLPLNTTKLMPNGMKVDMSIVG
jgi:transposase